ncbi:transcriptional regulator, TetR family [Cupriavidus sp. YR651]|uniref:TetR/AcrR family transcriptional regulator n=1 Tax=Cupriavidus sp. YR651 TaxID=1855315 RepID=UPI0008855996|nr:TetR/AcrR family transcriptional regulator [Cupriavidus sp. YR651]SDC54383.1 transcriptional regulator, TetR family [Cupriavidus sp. YR651]
MFDNNQPVGYYFFELLTNHRDMPRPANPEIRHRLLIDGGRVIHTAGFNGAGVQDIVAAADVPKGSFYSYFESKEAFAAAVLEAYWDSVEQRHGKVMYDARIAPLARIEKLFELLVVDHAAQKFRPGCLVGNLSLELSNTSSEVRKVLERILARWQGMITACLDEAKMRQELPADSDSEQLASIIIEAWEGAVMRSKVECSGDACRRFQQVTLKRLLI